MKKRPDIDAIVFDLGNVLVTYRPFDYLKKHYPEPLAERLEKTIFTSVHWNEMDRSVLTEEECFARMLKDAPDMAEWLHPAVAHYYDMIQPIEENIALLPKLKAAGYRLYVLSNYGAERFHNTKKRFPFFELFDGLLISGEEHLLKPDAAIYLTLLHKFKLDPSRIIFVDDKAENIDGASAVGIRGICYSHHEQLDALFAHDA